MFRISKFHMEILTSKVESSSFSEYSLHNRTERKPLRRPQTGKVACPTKLCSSNLSR